MTEYESTLLKKRQDVYKHLNELWFEKENTFFDGLHDLLDTLYFSEQFLAATQNNTALLKTVTALLSLKATTDIRIKELYAIVTDDQLYSALTHARMDHGYFAVALYLYIWNHSGFEDRFLSTSTAQWDKAEFSESGQAVFNSLIRICVQMLGIFYT